MEEPTATAGRTIRLIVWIITICLFALVRFAGLLLDETIRIAGIGMLIGIPALTYRTQRRKHTQAKQNSEKITGKMERRIAYNAMNIRSMKMEVCSTDFINLTHANLANEHLCCIIRSKKTHPGVEAKRQWLADRLSEGHIFRKLHVKGCVFIEYAPLETAWVPIVGENYLYIYCLWVSGDYKGKGYGKALMTYCLADAKAKGKSGVCMLGAKKQKAWLSDQSFAKKFAFETVDSTDNGYELLARSFDGTVPRFAPSVKSTITADALTIFYDVQCPYGYQTAATLQTYCTANKIPAAFVFVDTLQKAKQLPGVFNNWAVFYQGQFETVNLLSLEALKKILKKPTQSKKTP